MKTLQSDTLLKWDKMLSAGAGSVLYQRVGNFYDFITRGNKRIPTVYLIKPDRRRYWTRTSAIRDADNIAADIMTWQDNKEGVWICEEDIRSLKLSNLYTISIIYRRKVGKVLENRIALADRC
ncbi:MAG: hypothetical protein GY749_10595 [Desulfobacteraceae bacterium]|nr:hypothetical protein [Desulfobacteraceae bacterium]